jgi:integrase
MKTPAMRLKPPLCGASRPRRHGRNYVVCTHQIQNDGVLGLRWKDVDVKTGTLQVKQTLVRVTNHHMPKGEGRTQLIFQEPKTSPSRRTIPIPEECLAALKQHKARQAEEKLLLGQAYQDHGLVFCQANGKPIDPRNFLWSFDRIIEQAGLPPSRIHDARNAST